MTAPESLESFRQRARTWLKDNLPPRTPYTGDRDWDRERVVQRKLFEGGFAGICWPAEYGGLGLPQAYQEAFDEESMPYEMPLGLNVPTFGIIGATLLQFGTEEQKRRYVPPMLRGEEVWVQFLSEPTSGSDLASVTTRATLDGDAYVLNGSKVWSSGAYAADYAICVARTNWSVPKHDGITVFIMEIKQPGVTVDQIVDSMGRSEFCQEFFDDVRVPVENVIGQVDAGWTVVRGLLDHERNSVGAASPYTSGRDSSEHSGLQVDVRRLAVEHGLGADPEARQCVAQDYVLDFVQGQMKRRITEGVERGAFPPIAGSLLRLLSARVYVERSELSLRVAGQAAAAWSEGAYAGDVSSLYIARQGAEIGGGTTEIQRNIISERLLGMPREYAADRGVPFDQVRHNQAPRRKD